MLTSIFTLNVTTTTITPIPPLLRSCRTRTQALAPDGVLAVNALGTADAVRAAAAALGDKSSTTLSGHLHPPLALHHVHSFSELLDEEARSVPEISGGSEEAPWDGNKPTLEDCDMVACDVPGSGVLALECRSLS